jgi:hypothetical protein
MYKRKKLKNKKFKSGGSTGFEGSPELGGRGTTATYGFDQSGPSDNQTTQAKKDTGLKTDTATTSALNIIGKSVFDVTGAGFMFGAAKKAGSKLTQAVTPKVAKDTAKARLSGSPIYKFSTPRPITPTIGGDNDAVTQPLKKILKKPIQSDTTEVASFRPKDFFPFQAYKSGGVSSGPPPLKGPNPQVPPVKMRKGKMTKSYKFSCPSRPDGIRGMGAAIKGHKFTGVK